MLDDCFLLRKIEAYLPIEVFQVSVLMKMLNVASNFIDLSHHVVMMWAYKQLGSTPELTFTLSGI